MDESVYQMPLDREQFWKDMAAAYTALQQDPNARMEYQQELKSFEETLMDGLDPHEVWTEDGDAYFQVTIHLSSELYSQTAAEAQVNGLTVEEYLPVLITQSLPQPGEIVGDRASKSTA